MDGFNRGFYAANGSYIAADVSTATNNTTGYYAGNHGYIYADNSTVSGNSTNYNPYTGGTWNTGNNDSYIFV